MAGWNMMVIETEVGTTKSHQDRNVASSHKNLGRTHFRTFGRKEAALVHRVDAWLKVCYNFSSFTKISRKAPFVVIRQ